jgi:hypothetical protein
MAHRLEKGKNLSHEVMGHVAIFLSLGYILEPACVQLPALLFI